MISLDVKEYCSDCQDFEPVADATTYHIKGSILGDDDEVVRTDTVVRCKYRERCERVEAYLEGRKERYERVKACLEGRK